MGTDTCLTFNCMCMVKVIIVVDLKTLNTHNSSLEGAIYGAEIALFCSP